MPQEGVLAGRDPQYTYRKMPAIQRSIKQKEPQVLSSRAMALHLLGLPVAIITFIVGSAGIYVLMDSEGTSGLTNSLFGQYYKFLVEKNPFFAAFIFNAGLIGMIFVASRLVEHRVALAKRAEAEKKNKKKQ